MNIDDTLGPYRILGKLGAGGMGEVYRATDTSLKRQVAIKVLPAALAADSERLARFQREAEVLASLNHPHIAHIYGLERLTTAGQTDSAIALVMELVEGEDLSEKLKVRSEKEKGLPAGLPLDEALAIAKQVAEALEAAHEQNIVHRDLKPANIKVRADGTVKVLDFGLAKAVEPAGGAMSSMSMSPTVTTPAMTQAGMILGTAAYMSPEQARGKGVDKRADIWAFGCVFYEMLTGQRLFTGETVSDTLASVLKTDPAWSALPPATPTAVRRLLRRCLEKDPRQRLQAIGEARILLGEPLEEERDAPVAAPARQPSMQRFVPWSLAALLLATTLAVSFLHVRETPLLQESIRFQVGAPENSEIGMFSLSPDGRRLVFAERTQNGPGKLWLRSLDSVDAAPIAGTDGGQYPFWSPDGTEIGFFAQGKLEKIPVSGGLAAPLCEAVNGRGGTWNRDGVILFAPDAYGGLYRVMDTGGIPVAVTTIAAPDGDRFPEFLPDGQKFVFLRNADKDAGLYAATLTGSSFTRILPEISNAVYLPGQNPRDRNGFLLFRRNNTLMAQPFDPGRLQTMGGVVPVAEKVSIAGNVGYGAFTASRDGTIAYRSGLSRNNTQLVWLDRSGKRIGVVSKPDEIFDPALSPDGKAVAFTIGNPTAGAADIWLQNLETGVLSRLTFGPGASSRPTWSPDGSRIAFAGETSSSRRAGSIQLLPSTGAGRPEILLQGDYGTVTVSDWSRDGKFIAFNSRTEKTRDDLYLLPMGDDRKAIVFLQTPAVEINGKFSPDGQWIAYQSNESPGAGRPEVYVRHVPDNGAKFQISSTGGAVPQWSRDGKELFYSGNGQNLLTVPVKLGATFERGPARQLWEGVPLAGPVQPSADGQRFLAVVPDEGAQAAPITMVTHWSSTLKK